MGLVQSRPLRTVLGVLALAVVIAHGRAFGATESLLWSLGSGTDGSNPYGGLIMDARGKLYGTTIGGGLYDADFTTAEGGTVFELTRAADGGGNWTESVLWDFGNGADGQGPSAGLIIDARGNLYGTTQIGGTHGAGTVFELIPPATTGGSWAESILWSFGGNGDGLNPSAGLLMNARGALYGTTEVGGAHGMGTVFELTPPATSGGSWSDAILWSFGQGTDGALPEAGLLMDTRGKLYGTTIVGGAYGAAGAGGTVFALTPPALSGGNWTEAIIWSFGNGADGLYPRASLIMDDRGELYGVTTSGGVYGNGQFRAGGTVFKLTPDGKESVLWNFGNGTDGQAPEGGLIMGVRGSLYGTTYAGGIYSGGNSGGTVFEVSPAGNESVLWNFGDGTDGQAPSAGLIMDGRGKLLGTSNSGGIYTAGTVFAIATAASAGAEIRMTPTHVVFPATAIGDTSTAELTVRNTGTATLSGTMATPSAPFGLRGSGSFALPPKGETTLTLTFSPTATGNSRERGTVGSNAIGHGTIRVELRGTGTTAP